MTAFYSRSTSSVIQEHCFPTDLEVRDVRESVVNVDDEFVTVGDATIAGCRFTVLRSRDDDNDDELMCVVSEVFRLFFAGAYDYQKRQWWQKRYHATCTVTDQGVVSVKFSTKYYQFRS